METSKFRAVIKKNEKLKIPVHILEKIDNETEVEVVFRPFRQPSNSKKDVGQVIDEVKKKMDKKYPNLISPINSKLRAVAGVSRDIVKEYQKYSDKDIIAMGRMEKYLEKGEIIESLY